MKKLLVIILGILAATIVAAILFYYIRKNRSTEQEVYGQSQSIIAISIDDLLIDHVGQLLRPSSKDSTAEEGSKRKLWKDLWNAGVHIPAHLFLFNLAEEPTVFYSIQKVDDLDKWEKFLAKYAKDSSAIAAQEKHVQDVKINPFTRVVYVNNRLIIRLSAEGKSTDQPFPSIVSDPSKWQKVNEMVAFEKDLLGGHINYWTNDQNIRLQADIKDQKTIITGSWKVTEKTKESQQVRDLTPDSTAVLFWSNLPSANKLLIEAVINRFSEQEEKQHLEQEISYLDVLIKNKLITQEDTIIAYDYDENFNSVETKTVQQIDVPFIESTWMGGAGLSDQLPDKLFYKLFQSSQDSLRILSTQKSSADHYSLSPAAMAMQLRIDFRQWPATWLLDPIERLQKQAVNLQLDVKEETKGHLGIHGEINYLTLPF